MSSTFRIHKALAMAVAFLGLGLAAPVSMADSHKVLICHKGKTLNVAQRSIPGHQRHGDTLGACPNPIEEMRALTERVMLTCAVNAPEHGVTAATVSADVTDDIATVDLTAVSCPEALVLVDEAGCEEQSMVGAADTQTFIFACPSAADDALMDLQI